jgi:hypothetical protein
MKRSESSTTRQSGVTTEKLPISVAVTGTESCASQSTTIVVVQPKSQRDAKLF